MKLQSYKELKVWQKSIDLVDEIYRVTKPLPKSEMYGLASQMQRAAVAIPSNIAEGYGRNHRKEYLQFLGIAYSSASELETQLVIFSRIYEVGCDEINLHLDEIKKMLYVLISKLQSAVPRTQYPVS